MTIAIYPGSFDPVTNGHLDIAIRSANTFEKVIVGVMMNPKKTYTFSMEERVSLIKENLKEYPNVEVVGFDGLLVNYMKQHNVNAIVKGLRTLTDYEEEFRAALLNKRLYNGAETYFLPTSEQYSLVSSSMVKELLAFQGDIHDFVPPNVLHALNERMS